MQEGRVKRSDLRNGYEAKERSGDPVSSSSSSSIITRFVEGEIRITNNEALPYILPQEKESDQESPLRLIFEFYYGSMPASGGVRTFPLRVILALENETEGFPPLSIYVFERATLAIVVRYLPQWTDRALLFQLPVRYC